jgi:peptidoglycan/LPS O-acetylase OafA/YrhL
MMSSRLPRLARLDDLRAVAATLVFACHASLFWFAFHNDETGRVFPYLGRFGVAIFFVISGLVIYRPFVQARAAGHKQSLRAFARRRVLRIVPAYWIALVVFGVLLSHQVRPLDVRDFALFAGFGQIYSRHSYYLGLSVAWTLDIELCFYAAIPFLALGARWLIAQPNGHRLELAALLCLGLLSIAVRALDPAGVLGSTILGYAGWFAIGMALAVVASEHASWLRGIPLSSASLWVLAGLGYLLLVGHLPYASHSDQGTLLEYCGLGLLAALTVLAATKSSGSSPTVIGKWLGDRSYGIYLWHYPILVWLVETRLGGWAYITEGLCLTLLAAHLSFVLVERPLMQRTSLFRRQRMGDTSPASSSGEEPRKQPQRLAPRPARPAVPASLVPSAD